MLHVTLCTRTKQGVQGELGAAAPAIEDLDLSNNLLGRWDDVEALCRELPALHTLNVSQNLLAAPSARPSMQFSAMRRLVLNQCLLGVDQVAPKPLCPLNRTTLTPQSRDC